MIGKIMPTVLVVDDDPDALQVIAEMLASEPHRILVARSGLEALDIVESGAAIDLLVTDVIMPGLNGFNLARMVMSRLPRVKVLYLTGDAERAELSRDVGVKYGKLLRKPITHGELAREVQGILSR